MAVRMVDREMQSYPSRRTMVDSTHMTWCELPEVLIQDLQGTTYLEVPRESLYEFANPVRLPEGYDESWACSREVFHGNSSDMEYGQNDNPDSDDGYFAELERRENRVVYDTGAASDVVFVPIRMPSPRSPADPTFDADSDDDTQAGLPDLVEVDAAEVVHQPSMVHHAERLRVVYRGSVAQSSSDQPIPNSYLWPSMYGAIANVTSAPITTALSSADAELFSLAHAMGSVPVLGIAEIPIIETDSDRDPDGYEGDREEEDAHRQWHRENDEYMHLTRGQSSSSGIDVVTQTDFVPVLVPLRLLRGPPASPSSHPHVFAFLGQEID